jgi:hypothetical protein
LQGVDGVADAHQRIEHRNPVVTDFWTHSVLSIVHSEGGVRSASHFFMSSWNDLFCCRALCLY